MKKVNYLALGGLAASLMLFSGCQDEEFGYTKEEIKMQTSFEDHFGQLKPDQIWDFSSYNLKRLGLEGGFANVNGVVGTRATYNGVDDTPKMDSLYALTYPQFYKVPTELRQWIDKNLREEVYNKKRGTTNFTLKMPTDRDIVIIPIYQGQAGLNYNLCIKSEEKDESEQPLFPTGYIWEKSAGIEWAELGTEDWHGFGGDKSFYAHTVGREVHANPIRIKHDEVQGQFSLYLDILNLDDAWDNGNGLPFSQTFSDQKHASSLDGQMVAVSLSNSPETFQAVSEALKAAFTQPTDGKYTFDNFMLVGVEDSNLKRNIAGPEDPRLVGTDWDMNDMIFLVVGVKPNDIVYTKDEVISKRYMIEDLGSDFDYDFNDIVIDVTQRKHTDEQGVTTTTQTLSLKHLCGTIPWRVQVGDYTSPIFPGRNNNIGPEHVSQDGDPGYDPTDDDNTDRPNTPYRTWKGKNGETEVEGIIDITITGWDPDANNIIVTAWPNAAGEDIPEGASEWTTTQKENFLKEVDGKAYGFPENGKYPFIIACDQSNNWYPEHKTIPADAIVTWKKAGYETIITPGGGGGQGGEGGEGGEEEYEDDGYNSFIVPLPEPDEDGEIGVDLDVTFDSWTDDIVINPEYLQSIAEGYKIITHFEKIDANKQHLMYMNVDAPWTNIGGFYLDPDQNTLEVTVSPSNVNRLKTYGIALKGINVHISRIEIIPGEWEGYGEDLPWTGDFTAKTGEGLIFKPSAFENAQPGDRIIIENTESVHLFYNKDAGWEKFGDNLGKNVSYTLTEANIATLKQYGLLIAAVGTDSKITSVSLYRPTYATIIVNSADSSLGTVTGGGKYEVGTKITIKATANEGCRFVKWSDGDTNAQREITVSEDASYTAEFVALTPYTVTLSTTVDDEGASGTVEGAGTYYEGETYTIKAIPADNSVFVSWNDGNTDATRTINNIQADASYTAKFALKTYTVTVNATPSAGGTVIGGGTYKHNQEVELIAQANEGYQFLKWSDGVTNSTRKFNATENVILTAEFLSTDVVVLNAETLAANNYVLTNYVTPGQKYDFTITTSEAYKWIKVMSNVGGNEAGGQASSAGGSFTLTLTVSVDANSVILSGPVEFISSVVITPIAPGK